MGQIITSPSAGPAKVPLGVFLAGGISDCPDWQKAVAERLATNTDATVFNPRRADFDMSAYEDLSRAQIRWEYVALRLSPVNLFWFPEETLCPITLLELGSAMHRLRPGALMVGTHPNYSRRFDVIEQMTLEGHQGMVFDSLDELVKDTEALLINMGQLV